MIMEWLRRAVHAAVWWLEPRDLRLVLLRASRVSRAPLRGRTWIALTAWWVSLLAVSGIACADQFFTTPGNIVAAGFGYQNADASTITVKTYDAESGEVLSNDTYELDIKEEGPTASPQPRARIFAGGVGLGADGLSEFTLRVYDAADGRFLWEGRLNLRQVTPESQALWASASVRRSAIVRPIAHRMPGAQPYFVLRVVNPETGQLVWSDHFSTDPATVRVEPIARHLVGMDDTDARDVDFRIQMFDEESRRLLWEDQVIASDAGAGAGTGSDENSVGPMLNGSALRGSAAEKL
ncbi:MAG TPA: hypothetical protein VFS39_14330 [Nitrospira sp.]|nr:hypothetical protein [Nitrospira sp.]